MWLCTQQGFFSIVQKQKNEFHIRARKRRDLDNLSKLGGYQWQIIRTDQADYRFRVVVNQATVTSVLLNLSEDIDYDNFKSRIHDLPDQKEKTRAYAALWHDLYDLQKYPVAHK